VGGGAAWAAIAVGRLSRLVHFGTSSILAGEGAPIVDYADLDGNLLISNDPFTGVQLPQGKRVLPEGPGLGVTPA
jgi:L-Ala-D/L-Glu epimerase / N-acetyl-D-glutamate racemase